MSEFCSQCSKEIFGEDHKDLAGFSSKNDTENGLFAIVLCEGCGKIQVDHEGKCISLDCLKKGHSK